MPEGAGSSQHGFDDVELVDANIEAYDRFLSRAYWSARASACASACRSRASAPRASSPFRDMAAFRAAAESAASADALIARIDEAKAVLRGGAFYDVGALRAGRAHDLPRAAPRLGGALPEPS